MSCPDRHGRDDSRLGQPLCPDCYDYTRAVLFNALAPELWRRFTITLRRVLARRLGITNTELAQVARVSYAKVAEYQQRGVVHFHAIIRIDGPAGPATPPPASATADLLTAAITVAVSAVATKTRDLPGMAPFTMIWGRQLDIRPISTTGELTDSKVAAYLAKYATKAAECTGTLDRRITPADHLASLPVTGHARRLIAECLRLDRVAELEDLRLAAWAHMLGFRGHFSTKSRHYSTTLGRLRAARADHCRALARAAGLVPDLPSDTTLVVGHWHFGGRGHPPSVDPRSDRPCPTQRRSP